jgi:hypothetical protein
LVDATKEAQSEGRTLKFAIGECTSTSEKYWNSVGWKRAYGKTEKENEYKEIEYVQPALDFDEDTGKIAEDAGEAPEHMMIDNFGSATITKADIVRSCKAFTDYNIEWPREAFNSDEAHATQKAYLDSYNAGFANMVNSGGELIFLSQQERKDAKKEGLKIKEYKAADHGEAGKEDF